MSIAGLTNDKRVVGHQGFLTRRKFASWAPNVLPSMNNRVSHRSLPEARMEGDIYAFNVYSPQI